MNAMREAFERIAVKAFKHPHVAEDHWQTWQEAWEEATRIERERCITECMNMRSLDGDPNARDPKVIK